MMAEFAKVVSSIVLAPHRAPLSLLLLVPLLLLLLAPFLSC